MLEKDKKTLEFKEGAYARVLKKPIESNPYSMTRKEISKRNRWIEGWTFEDNSRLKD